jgi:hypothetical protein
MLTGLRDGSIVWASTAETLFGEEAGFHAIATHAGTAYGHGGRMVGLSGGYQPGVNAAVIRFGDGVDGVLVLNANDTGKLLRAPQLLRDAYHAAFYPELPAMPGFTIPE